MGFFDKLQNVLNAAESKVRDVLDSTESKNQGAAAENTASEKAKEPENPLADETVKKYFDIMCGMGKTFLRDWGDYSTMEDVRTKRYVEHFLGDVCDEAALEKAKNLYERSEKGYGADFELKRHRESVEKSGEYRLGRYEAHVRCCKEEIDATTIRYNDVLDVIKDNVNYNHFSQGLRTIDSSTFIKSIVTANSFCEDNPITRQLVLEYVIASYIGRAQRTPTQIYDYHDDVAQLALKALHFEKHGNDQENYVTVTDEDYRNFVLNVSYYKDYINDHPFEKEEYTTRLIKGIKKGKTVSGIHTIMEGDYFDLIGVNDYFCDYVCNAIWKEIASKRDWMTAEGECVKDSEDANDVFGILCAYLKDPDEE